MSIIKAYCTIECDRCARQQTAADPFDLDWVMYENVNTKGTVTLCPACASFFYDFMQGKEVRALR